MEMTIPMSGGELAQIFLKNGQKFFGILLHDLEAPDSFDHEVRFVKPSNLSSWLETSDEGFVEVVETEHVDGIDLYLK